MHKTDNRDLGAPLTADTVVARPPVSLELETGAYLGDLADLDMTEDQKRELLETLWSIMCSFAELGFSVDVCGLLLDDFNDASASGGDRARLASSPSMETPSDGSDTERQQ